jgi:hypothetical protein
MHSETPDTAQVVAPHNVAATADRRATFRTVTAGLPPVVLLAAIAVSAYYVYRNPLQLREWLSAVQAPALCTGIGTGAMRNQIGAVFTGMFGPDPATSPITVQFHYRVPAAKGKPDTNCSNTLDPNRSKADVCGAGWSETKDP